MMVYIVACLFVEMLKRYKGLRVVSLCFFASADDEDAIKAMQHGILHSRRVGFGVLFLDAGMHSHCCAMPFTPLLLA